MICSHSTLSLSLSLSRTNDFRFSRLMLQREICRGLFFDATINSLNWIERYYLLLRSTESLQNTSKYIPEITCVQIATLWFGRYTRLISSLFIGNDDKEQIQWCRHCFKQRQSFGFPFLVLVLVELLSHDKYILCVL